MEVGGSRAEPDELETYASVRERDTDLVLVMALRASSEVRRVFREAAGWGEMPLLKVWHSLATTDGREVDVEAVFGAPTARRVLHIENKIDAVFQPGQVESYRERVRKLRQEEEVVAAATLLFCPADYAEVSSQANEFDALVSYEEVRDATHPVGPWGREAALLIDHAILQFRRGGVSSPDDPQRTRFFAELAKNAENRGLPTLPPRARKAGASFMWYPRDKTLSQLKGWTLSSASQGAWLVAKLVAGNVDIELTAISRRLNREVLRSVLEDTPFRFVATKAGVILRAESEPLNPDLPYEEQVEAAETVIDSLLALQSWWEEEGRVILERLLAETPNPDVLG